MNTFLRENAPRWVILSIDLLIGLISIISAYLLRFNFDIPDEYFNIEKINSLYYVIPFFVFIRFISFFVSKTYAGIVRFTNTKDATRIFIVLLIGSIVFLSADVITFIYLKSFIVPISIIGIDFLANTIIMIAFRIIVKFLYLEYISYNKQKANVIIYGANENGITTQKTLNRDAGKKYNVVAFIDDSLKTKGKKLNGINIYQKDKLDSLLHTNNISMIILAKKGCDTKEREDIIEICLNNKIKVLTLPDIDEWINGELSFNQIRNVNIEDLLERPPIKLDEQQIRNETFNKTILVSGAAGSIGSEIVRQLTRYNPRKIIVLDQAESPLYDLELELREKFNYQNFRIIIADISNKKRMEQIFVKSKPCIVYHAAAYKHVPMMEKHPSESIKTNVMGTKIMADLSVKYKVSKFIMVSTDKAVNPTNVMGASKRIAEIYIQSLNSISKTNFITTRFGNVLGSNGSVIPRFRNQIEKGGPVTVTHPKVTRYFMTIPEACQLVLEASALGKGGEIFIFDMGKSVKIVDLAKKMIRLSGLELGKDIHLIYTGLRPGEKLYEELLNSKENTLPTHHSQIMIAKVRTYNFEMVDKSIKNLVITLNKDDNYALVKVMKEIVPEFKSHNSIYERIDREIEALNQSKSVLIETNIKKINKQKEKMEIV